MFSSFFSSSRAKISFGIILYLHAHDSSHAFSVSVDQSQRSVPSKVPFVNIELPNFDHLFDDIREVSPLAALLISDYQKGKGYEGDRGFAAADELRKSCS